MPSRECAQNLRRKKNDYLDQNLVVSELQQRAKHSPGLNGFHLLSISTPTAFHKSARSRSRLRSGHSIYVIIAAERTLTSTLVIEVITPCIWQPLLMNGGFTDVFAYLILLGGLAKRTRELCRAKNGFLFHFPFGFCWNGIPPVRNGESSKKKKKEEKLKIQISKHIFLIFLTGSPLHFIFFFFFKGKQ